MSDATADNLKNRTLVEQIKLIYNLVGLTVIPTMVAGVIMYVTLRKPETEFLLRLWLAGVVGCKLYQQIDAARQRSKDFTGSNLKRETIKLMLIHGTDALIWTMLAWISLGTATPGQAILIVSTLTAIVAGSVPLMSPVLPVFFTFAAVDFCVLVPRFFLMGDPSYIALALASLPFLFAMAMMARNGNQATKQSIHLRFENLELTRNLLREAQKSEAAYAEAVEANIVKARFMAAASHDLRQPIHALGLFLEVLNLKNKQPEQQAIIDSSLSAAKATSEMLNTLLDFSRVEAGVVKPRLKAFAIQDIFRSIETELAPLADEKQITYRTRDSMALAWSDSALVELILRNLISNAIRYTHEGGVLIGCRRRKDYLSIEVWDTGIGIDATQHGEIFKEFYQLGNPERDRRKGLGLGLAIASRLANALNASLTLRSVPGRGSLFRLEIPTADGQQVPAREFAPAISTNLKRHRVLVVDDDEAIRMGMSTLLADWGFDCVAVGTLSEASQQFKTQVPDLIISDLRLRDKVDGISVISELRKTAGRDVPAIVITGETSPQALKEAEASGLTVMHKPMLGDRLAQEIAKVMTWAQPNARRD